MKSKLSRRFLYSVGAAVVALALIVSGAFAWADYSQHKSNVVQGGSKIDNPDVKLVEKFEEPDDPDVGEEIEKEIWVKNTGDSALYIRLQLKEYMEISKMNYTYSDEYLLVDSDGKFVASENGTGAAQLAAFKLALDEMGVTFTDSQIVTLKAYGDTVERYYLATSATTNINGKYGTRMLLDYTEDAPKSLVDGVVRGSYEETIDHKNHPTSECLYTPHLWNKADVENCEQGADGSTPPQGFHDYFEWELGAPLILLSAWDGVPTAAWILDDSSSEGWAYWGQSLQAGESTEALMKSFTMIKRPDGPYYYAIHVDMEAVDNYYDKFDNAPQKIADAYDGKTGFAISAGKYVVAKGGTVTFKASWNGTKLENSDVTWSVANMDTAALHAQTKISANGVLTASASQAEGKLRVTAAYNSPDGAKTQSYIVTVK